MKRKKDKAEVTPATMALDAAGVEYVGHPYKYEDHGGTAVCARELNVDEHAVIKTLVMKDDSNNPLVVLMHGDMKVSTKELARAIGAKSVTSADPAEAERLTGYKVGGTSPFGMRKDLPVYVEGTILELPRIYINGGKRGFLVSMVPSDIASVLSPATLTVGIR